MSDAIQKAKQLIDDGNYNDALKIARKRHGKDEINDYLNILDLLIEKDYLLALEEKGLYYQYYDPNNDNGDYGEKYFNQYLEKQSRSVNVICDKALSRFNKGHVDEAIELMDKAYANYNKYSKIEEPRISKKEVEMGKIELLIQAGKYDDTISLLNKYENQYGRDEKLSLYKGQMLQKSGKNEEAVEYLDYSLQDKQTIAALNAKGDALYSLGQYSDALKCYKNCIKFEREVDDLELLTNFNYKAAYCEIKQGNNESAVKYLNKTINTLNEYGRLPKDIEEIYQKCSFKKEELLKNDNVKDKEFRKSYFVSSKVAIIALIIILILYVILKYMGY